jgi:tetratricopeptide (TPR) repeat protein
MTKKKNTQLSVSQEENAQVQHILEQYHQIANNLHVSEDHIQAEAALAELNDLPESAQIFLLKELSKENQVDAADVLTAIYKLSPLKSVRKEARRSLIRLESTKIYPRWELPIDQPPAISVIQAPTNPPRFWKGMVSDTDAAGRVQLLLFWEQGEDYKEVRTLGFYLEFENEGVKDFFTSIDSKRTSEKFLAEIAARKPNIKWKNCSLAEGRRLLVYALAVHALNKTIKTPIDYRAHIPLINQLVFETESITRDEGSDNLHNLAPQEVIINFIESWVYEDYGTAFDLLSQDSPLRQGLSRDEWIERRQAWAKAAEPGDLEPGYVYEREEHKPNLWLPKLLSKEYSATHKEFEAAWSFEMDEIPLSEPLPELPQTILIYEETQRHWFWASYILVQEDDDWRIQSMTDEGLHAQILPIEDLQNELQEFDKQLETFAENYKHKEAAQTDEDAENDFEEMGIRIMRGIHYTAALIKKLPLDLPSYEEAATRMLTLQQHEHCLAYVTLIIQNFPEQRGLYLRRQADLLQMLSKKYSDQRDEERAERHQELAMEALRESLTIENDLEAHMSLAELLLGEDELDEAEDHLLQAKDLITNSEEETEIEFHLGEIAMEREQYEEALSHYQHAVEIDPEATTWFAIGEAHHKLGHFEEAEASYKRAIELEPNHEGYPYALSQLYTENDQSSKAIKVLKEGLLTNPDSILLHIATGFLYMDSGDFHQVEILLKKAEHIDPTSPLVHTFRQTFDLTKRKQIHLTNKQSEPLKGKKKKRRR